MCGITGFIDSSLMARQAEMLDTVSRMTASMELRGPDDQGVWADERAGIALGQRRLAILDLSPGGRQPMQSASGRFVIVFNGEIYNYRGIRERLESEGAAPRWRGTSDTEVMLACFERWGIEKSLDLFNGMFAFALWDRTDRKLHLARDRFGEKPLYYGRCGPVLLFGSELKALRTHPRFNAGVDARSLALYLRHNYIPAPWSIYQSIRKLPPASWLTFDGETGETAAGAIPYWSAHDVAGQGLTHPFRGTLEEAVEQLEDLLQDSVRLRMAADVPLGAFLSGGIDSSAVVALMQRASPRPVRTFTIGFYESGYDEAGHARAVARHIGTDHTEHYVTAGEAMEVIPRLPAMYDEPFADSSQIPTFLVSRLARRHVTVSLSGDAGDELFGGYVRYHWGRTIWRASGWWPSPVKRAASALVGSIPPERWNSLFDRISPWLDRRYRLAQPGDKLHKLANVLAAASSEDMYLRLTSLWQDPAQVVAGVREPPTPLTHPLWWIPAADLTHRMMYLDTITYLPDDILVKLDRASMGVSLESRVPMLDPRVYAFAWRLPLAMKVSAGAGKHILRQVLYRHVPPELVERPKNGFGIPIHEWLRGPLRGWAEELLDERRLRSQDLLQAAPIRKAWSDHLSGQRNWSGALWGALMFQAWLEAQKAPAAPARQPDREEAPAVAAV
ncbi:MAG: asparagine synthase (glutamine-hydrolyzing) [Bryobacteraceae bacterium]